jgi:hypothetical protein
MFPSYQLVFNECCGSPNMITTFDRIMDMQLSTRNIFRMIKEYNGLTWGDRFQIDSFRDFIVNLVYIPIIFSNDYSQIIKHHIETQDPTIFYHYQNILSILIDKNEK